MHVEASDLFKKADDELNLVYQEILSEYQTDSIFIKRLKEVQMVWISFRDAELEMRFPIENKQLGYGSSYPVCALNYLTELTEKRIEHLKTWTKGIEEGEMCTGSVKLKSELKQLNDSKAYIEQDSIIWIHQNMNSEHRIFGYENKNILSKKLILISVFTKDVQNNPFNCKYGSYYHTQSMNDLKLKYLDVVNDFTKIAILKKEEIIDTVYMESKWFRFNEE
jgi:uncharacterized protein YecT (DUF1311 family)